MPTRNTRSIARSAKSNGYDRLLACRMEMLGLDSEAARQSDLAAFDRITELCSSCSFREPCAVDLKRDPNNPVWETYCPSAGMLIDLAARQSAAV
jgi:hypothetical protein